MESEKSPITLPHFAPIGSKFDNGQKGYWILSGPSLQDCPACSKGTEGEGQWRWQQEIPQTN